MPWAQEPSILSAPSPNPNSLCSIPNRFPAIIGLPGGHDEPLDEDRKARWGLLGTKGRRLVGFCVPF